jgi:hypothetical protein
MGPQSSRRTSRSPLHITEAAAQELIDAAQAVIDGLSA